MDDDDISGTRARLKLTGELTLTIPPAIEARFTRIEATFKGDFHEPAQPFLLMIEGKLDEIRKLGALSPAILELLREVADAPGDTHGVITLGPPPEHFATLREAARGTPPMDVQALLANEPFMAALFAFDRFEGVGIGTIERWTQP